MSQKPLLNDLEKTGTRYAAGFNINKEENIGSPKKKESTENENQLMLSPEDLKNSRGGDDTLRR